jgi:Domain of unknown function (DUF4113)/impB/mucB/samB family
MLFACPRPVFDVVAHCKPLIANVATFEAYLQSKTATSCRIPSTRRRLHYAEVASAIVRCRASRMLNAPHHFTGKLQGAGARCAGEAGEVLFRRFASSRHLGMRYRRTFLYLSACAGAQLRPGGLHNFYASCERVFQPELRGKPIAVLPNNDGCVIARSNEAKAPGIEMGAPWHLHREKFEPYGVVVRCSNYTLYRYKKAGVMLLDLGPASSVQEGLFDRADDPRSKARMKALGAINGRYGRDMLTFASTARGRAGKLRPDLLSPRFTTCWNELLSVS